MREYIGVVKEYYDYILIDCMPSFGMITINAFSCEDSRTNYAKDISAMLQEAYGSKIRIFANNIPISVRAAEISAFMHMT